jgi:adenosylmethionine-8-amino-7-oxononanoate transaminase
MNDLVQRDLKHNWHPYTQMKDCEDMPPIPIERAEGVRLFGCDGAVYYDTISSWWCNVHGHGHPAIKDAIKDQIDKLEHVLFAGFTHAPAVELSERLVGITPCNLKKVFYSDNGSTAVEVALKMSLQYWRNSGKNKKTSFLSLDRAYHGDTVGAMSVSGKSSFNKAFETLLFRSFKAPTPYCYRCPCGKEKDTCSLECLDAMEDILKKNAEAIAAVIIEPILMGAGGMIIYPVKYLKGVGELARKYGVHLIADEVATGFGRTGKMFACEHAGVEPDFMCISKGVTSGYLPLGITMTTQDVFSAFYDDHERSKTFYHGHTYTANPLACAAAVKSIDLFTEENSLNRVGMISVMMGSFLEVVQAFPLIGDTRSIGAVGAMELVKNKSTKEPFPEKERIGLEVYKKGLDSSLLLRPLGNVVYLFLPLCVKKEELEDIFQRTAGVLASIRR